MGYHKQPECFLDPGNPPERAPRKRNPLMPANADPQAIVKNEWNATEFIEEAFTEVMAAFSESDRAEFVRALYQGDTVEWGQMVEAKMRNYLQDSVYDMHMRDW